MWSPSRPARFPPGGPGPRRRAGPRRAPGITLIELLAALTILTLVLALAYGSFFQISKAALDLTGELDEQQELRLLLRMIADDLQASRYLANFAAKQGSNPARPSGIIARVRFVGKTEFSFVSFHAAAASRFFRERPAELDPGLHEIGYGVVEDTATHTLNLVRREDFYLDDDLETGGVSVILTRRLETFSLAFLLPLNPGSTTEQWNREWDSTQQPDTARMPRAIRIGLGIVGKDGHPVRGTLEVNLPETLNLQGAK